LTHGLGFFKGLMGSLCGSAHSLYETRSDGKAKEGRPVPKAKKEKALKSNLSAGTFHDRSPCVKHHYNLSCLFVNRFSVTASKSESNSRNTLAL